MAKLPPVGGAVGRFSWLNFCKPTALYRVKGSLANRQRYDYWELFIPPEIPSSDSDTVHVVGAGERIDNISYKYYGTPLLWWVIAERNNIDLPLADLRQGLELTIPARSIIDNILQPNA